MPVARFCSVCAAALPAPPPVRCRACGAEHWHNPKPCAAAVVVRDGEVLLGRRAHAPWCGAWAPPGGFVDAGEHPIDAAEREAFEEVGLRVRVTDYLGVWVDRYADEPDDGAEIINVAYYLATLVGDATPSVDAREVADAGWFPWRSLPAPLGPPGTLESVLSAARERLIAGLDPRPARDRRPRLLGDPRDDRRRARHSD